MGSGGDPYLNELRNRDRHPFAVGFATIDDLLGKPMPEATSAASAPRKDWSLKAFNEVFPWEQRLVRLYGYLAKAEDGGPEHCNCDGKVGNTTRVWIVWQPGDYGLLGSKAVVGEIPARMKDRYPHWTASWLNHLVSRRTRVRITGWLMWDDEAASEVGKSRGTAWEIAPVQRIEYFERRQWHDFLNESSIEWGGH